MSLDLALGTDLSWQMWETPRPRVESRRPKRLFLAPRPNANQKTKMGRPAKDERIRVLGRGGERLGLWKIMHKLRGRKYPTFIYLVDNEHVYVTSTERSAGALVGAYVPGVTIDQLHDDIRATAVA